MQEINWNNFQQDLIDRNQKIEKAWQNDLEKGEHANHKYLRKEGDKYIYYDFSVLPEESKDGDVEKLIDNRTEKLLKFYYEKDKGKRIRTKKRNLSEKSVKIELSKLGGEKVGFSIAPDELERGKFKIIYEANGDAEGLSFDQYKERYGSQLRITAKSQIEYESKNK